MPKRSINKRLTNFFVDCVTGNPIVEDISPITKKETNPSALELGRMGGKKSGKARAATLSPERRKEIAKKAAASRCKSS